MIKNLKELIKKIAKWFEEDTPDNRVNHNDAEGRAWFLKTLDYQDTLKLEDLSNFTDRSELNNEYVTRYREKEIPSRKGISALKIEISALYAFNKCFVERYKGRLHYYRADLSQKGARNLRSVAQAMAKFEELKKNLA